MFYQPQHEPIELDVAEVSFMRCIKKYMAIATIALLHVNLVSCVMFDKSPVAPEVKFVTTTDHGLPKPGARPNRLASDPYQALALEGLYAIDQHHDGRYTQTYQGSATSNWSYLLNDPNAYNYIKVKYGSDASVWTGWPSYFSNMDVYSRTNLNRWGAAQADVLSHGGQCRGFANLLTYRSATFQQKFPGYEGCSWGYRPYSQIRVGDVIETTWANGHTAVVVAIVSGVAGSSVTSVRVVDSNYVGGNGQEIIGMHTISVSSSGGVGDLRNYHALNLPLS